MDQFETSELEEWNSRAAPCDARPMKQRWFELIGEWWPNSLAGDPAPLAEFWFNRLESNHSHADRHYHNFDHVRQILDLMAVVKPEFECIEKILAFMLTAWFHDAVYDSRRRDNEERSAALFQGAAKPLCVPPVVAEMTREWILATKQHSPTDAGAAAFCDVDLAILGSSASVYENYQAAIRREYEWVSDDDYKAGRSKVLRSFLERERIYKTSAMHDWLEASARRNLSLELATLDARE